MVSCPAPTEAAMGARRRIVSRSGVRGMDWRAGKPR